MRRLTMILVLVCSSVQTGCVAHGLQNDQDKIRHTLLDLCTNQIMDNLIRQHNGMPIIHLDYSNAFSQITVTDKAGLSDGLITNNPGVLSKIAGSAATVVTSTMNTVTGTLSADRANQVSVIATPVTAGDEVYNAYREFLKIPGSLRESCSPPPAGAAHLCKKCGCVYYWVPAEYKMAFLHLALTTTAQRAQPVAPLDAFFAAKIVDVLKTVDDDSDAGKQKIYVKLSKKIPIDTGRIEITAASAQKSPAPAATDKTAPTPLGKGAPAAPAPAPVGGGSDSASKTATFDFDPDKSKSLIHTDEIIIYFKNSQGVFKTAQDLQNLDAKLTLRSHRPVTPAINDVGSRIEFQLQQIQFNQTRLGTGP